ncbi:sulfite exporter TauE/SafE family protein [Candidatus Dojkabacteria bacterium]|nr:sulfite exporter TauE/SafE family protein [Candidatus Dojkabacteria bacterium]
MIQPEADHPPGETSGMTERTKMNKQTKKYEFYVEGMHCPACELYVEKKLSKIKGIKTVNANLTNSKVVIESYNPIKLDAINPLIQDQGYKIVKTKESANPINRKELVLGLLIALVFMSLFFLLQKSGIVSFLNSDKITLPFIFLIGIIASLSTCMAVVGGLVLSISSTFSKQKNVKPLVAFHFSRLIGFFILGGIVGTLGSAFILTPKLIFAMNIILFIVMVIMGINLLDVTSFFKRFQFKAPKSVGRNIMNLSDKKGIVNAGLLGVATFILPCGFTQSMQLYALSTKTFIDGGLTMLIFALGTLPVLAAISFASVKFSQGIQSGLFYKTAGFIIILFALFNFLTGLVAVGLIPPMINI